MNPLTTPLPHNVQCCKMFKCNIARLNVPQVDPNALIFGLFENIGSSKTFATHPVQLICKLVHHSIAIVGGSVIISLYALSSLKGYSKVNIHCQAQKGMGSTSGLYRTIRWRQKHQAGFQNSPALNLESKQ